MTPGQLQQVGTPYCFCQEHFMSAMKKTFSSELRKFLSVQTRTNPSTASQIKLFDMKNFVTKSALVSIYNSKQHDFLYIIKQVNSDIFLPKCPKAVVKDMIKTEGLYQISYRIYKNEAGYESIYISKAAKIKTS
jgi:hypothetical protein